MNFDLKIFFFLFTLFASPAVSAGGIYQEPSDFIKQVFNGETPKAKVLWLDKELKSKVVDILDHKYKGLRIRYWQDETTDSHRTVWILDEVGKEKMITTGFVINQQHIELVKILAFRESRGWEIRHDFFTDQFKQLTLKDPDQGNFQLDKTIDNISGATLSVRAVRKLAQIALLLDRHVQNKAIQ